MIFLDEGGFTVTVIIKTIFKKNLFVINFVSHVSLPVKQEISFKNYRKRIIMEYLQVVVNTGKSP